MNSGCAPMAEWRFPLLPVDLVEQEPTQRDQFNNDEVGLSQALVREVIQNSTDAGNGNQVKVRFAITTLTGDDAKKLADYFSTLLPHLEASGVNIDPLIEDTARVLVIEDFNTSGLTGATDHLDDNNFRNFWRRHGKSEKQGKAGGRWGLGKLVYSSSSALRCFFGLTLRDGDTQPYLMGQAVLATHEFNGERRPPHGFWYRTDSSSILQLPVSDASLVQPFVKLVNIVRATETGLSLAIPYPFPSITEESLIAGVVENYYFPILSGRLVVEVGDKTIDRHNFLKVAEGIPGLAVPFGFVSAVSDRLNGEPDATAQFPIHATGITEEQFSGQLEALRKRLADGELVHVRLPVELTRKGASKKIADFDVFLRNPETPGDSFALFVRGSLTVPGERARFNGVPAWGAMVAQSGDVAEFLGDAENPAHTHWNSSAEKLLAKWQTPTPALRAIRNAPYQLQQLLAGQIEQTDRDALIDFFSLVDQLPTADAKKKRRTRQTPIVIEPRPKTLLVQPRKGGFAVSGGEGVQKWPYPAELRVRIAYDIIGANPFKRWSPFDFQMNDPALEISLTDAELVSNKNNVLRIRAKSPSFRVEATGFDLNRDLVVEARSV